MSAGLRCRSTGCERCVAVGVALERRADLQPPLRPAARVGRRSEHSVRHAGLPVGSRTGGRGVPDVSYNASAGSSVYVVNGGVQGSSSGRARPSAVGGARRDRRPALRRPPRARQPDAHTPRPGGSGKRHFDDVVGEITVWSRTTHSWGGAEVPGSGEPPRAGTRHPAGACRSQALSCRRSRAGAGQDEINAGAAESNGPCDGVQR